jgi:hypothetical protein
MECGGRFAWCTTGGLYLDHRVLLFGELLRLCSTSAPFDRYAPRAKCISVVLAVIAKVLPLTSCGMQRNCVEPRAMQRAHWLLQKPCRLSLCATYPTARCAVLWHCRSLSSLPPLLAQQKHLPQPTRQAIQSAAPMGAPPFQECSTWATADRSASVRCPALYRNCDPSDPRCMWLCGTRTLPNTCQITAD